jgi:hypothetical protein
MESSREHDASMVSSRSPQSTDEIRSFRAASGDFIDRASYPLASIRFSRSQLWLKEPFHRVRTVERLAVARIVVEHERLRHCGFTPIGHDGRRLGYTLWPGKPVSCVKALREFGWEVTVAPIERRVPALVWCLIGVGLLAAGVAWSAATGTGGGGMLVVVGILMVGTYLRGRAIARLVDSASLPEA